MNNFIEVTGKYNDKHLVNVNEIWAVGENLIHFINPNNTPFNCKESYEELKAKIIGDTK